MEPRRPTTPPARKPSGAARNRGSTTRGEKQRGDLVSTLRQYSVRVVGRLESVRERFYAISVEKKVKHPAVLAIADEARQKLFG